MPLDQSMSPSGPMDPSLSGSLSSSGIYDGQPDNYDNFKQNSSYSYDSGMVAIPIAGPDGTPPCVVKLYAAIGMLTRRTSAAKVNTPPIMPSIAFDTKEGDLFLSGTLNLLLPQINQSQTGFNYYANSEYTYVQPGAPRGSNPATDTFQSGEYPFEIPLIFTLAGAELLATIGNSGNPYTTELEAPAGQEPPAFSGEFGVDKPDWFWLSTTWLPAFFSANVDSSGVGDFSGTDGSGADF